MKKILLAVSLFVFTLLMTPLVIKATTTSSMYGFTYTTDGFISLGDGWDTYLSMPVVDINNYTLGVATTFIGRYQVDPEVLEIDNGMYVTMVKVIMTPYEYPSVNIYGFSDDLIIESNIDDYPDPVGNELANYSPTTTATSTTYNVGFTAGTINTVSASGVFRAGDLYIHNQSSTPTQHYGTYFNYDLVYGSWCVKTYFREETAQYSLFVVETPENEEFSNELIIYARFNMGSSSTYFTCVNSLNYAVEWAHYYYYYY